MTAALLAALGAAASFRPGRLTVRSAPSAIVHVDGDVAGVTPLTDRGIAAGTHHLELRRDGFEPFHRAFEVDRGGTYDLDVVLRAIDPADRSTLEALAAARGIERTDVDVRLDRATAGKADLAVLLPRGKLSVAPSEVSVWAAEPQRGVRLRLERAPTAGVATTVHEWDVPAASGQVGLAVPDGVRTTITPGAYRLRIEGDGRAGIDAEFEVVASDAALRLASEVDGAVRGFAADDPAATLLRSEALLGRGFVVDALVEAARGREHLGDRREVARLVLAAFDRVGLRDIGPWFDWASLYVAAEK